MRCCCHSRAQSGLSWQGARVVWAHIAGCMGPLQCLPISEQLPVRPFLPYGDAFGMIHELGQVLICLPVGLTSFSACSVCLHSSTASNSGRPPGVCFHQYTYPTPTFAGTSSEPGTHIVTVSAAGTGLAATCFQPGALVVRPTLHPSTPAVDLQAK